jgi:copper oxidase (laccase) domain-containing protein
VLRAGRPGHWYLDVAGANRVQLVAAGVPATSVRRSATTTADIRLFSDRRWRPCGRFGLLARLAG